MDSIRQDIDVLYEWMGGPTYTPSTSHDHNGVNSKLIFAGWNLVNVQTAAAAANMTFSSGLTTVYDEYILKLTDITVSTDDASISFQCSTDSGSSFLGTNIYQLSYISIHSASTVVIGSGVTAAAQVLLNNDAAGYGVGNAANESFNGTIEIHLPTNTEFKQFDMRCGYTNPTSNKVTFTGSGECGTTSVINGIRFSPSAGTFSGTGRLYGIRKTT